jgi:response regulator RpfG family c-di-GMP phosphodiesterase
MESGEGVVSSTSNPGMPEESKIVLLCVDDEPLGLEVRKVVLQRQGYDVLTATNGREALKIFSANPVEAVILDYSMPEMNGCQVAAELKRMNPKVKILLLSAYLDLPEEVSKYVDARAVKATSPTAFLNALQQLLS